jgi:hypothetical protein
VNKAVIPTLAPLPAPDMQTLTDADLKKRKVGVGSGAINTVDKVTYKKPIAKAKEGFFKPEPASSEYAGLGEAATIMGIKGMDLRASSRSVATSITDEMLGLDVVTRTRPAEHGGVKGSVSEAATGKPLFDKFDAKVTDPVAISDFQKYEKSGDLGLTDAYKKGKDFYKKKDGTLFYPHDFSRKETQRSMNDLQWEDALTGQVDRHGGNIFIDPKTGKAKAIDHDAAFGSADMAKDPRDLAHNPAPFSPTQTSHNRGLPEMIDVETAARFRALDWAQLKQAYEQAGLSAEEIEATRLRLEVIKAHIATLEQQGKIVGAKDADGKAVGNYQDWDAQTFNDQVAKPNSSYLGTAVENLEQARQTVANTPKGQESRHKVGKLK